MFDVSSAPLTLSADLVELTGGELWIGSEECPYAGEAEVLLTGRRDESEGAPGVQKAVLVREGVLEVHGMPKMSWTSLAATVLKTSREEMTAGAIHSAYDSDNNMQGTGIFMFEFDSSGNRVRNWRRVTSPSKFSSRKGNVALSQSLYRKEPTSEQLSHRQKSRQDSRICATTDSVRARCATW